VGDVVKIGVRYDVVFVERGRLEWLCWSFADAVLVDREPQSGWLLFELPDGSRFACTRDQLLELRPAVRDRHPSRRQL
jgi:hypothetical protein